MFRRGVEGLRGKIMDCRCWFVCCRFRGCDDSIAFLFWKLNCILLILILGVEVEVYFGLCGTRYAFILFSIIYIPHFMYWIISFHGSLL